MVDTLTKPRVIELGKLYAAVIQFCFARARSRKYGYREPEPSQLFETLRIASTALSDKEPELYFRFQHYLMKHSSVNGLVNEQTVQEMYDMLVENSRKYLDYPLPADAKSLQFTGEDRKSPQEQSTGKGSMDYACHFVVLLIIG